MTAWTILLMVKQALDEEDIEGLLQLGCPSDEYDGKASLIEDAVAKKTDWGQHDISVDQLESLIRSVWNKHFGPMSETQLDSRRPAFRRVAEKLKGIRHA